MNHSTAQQASNSQTTASAHEGHRLMMIVFCAPIFIIGIFLVATGVIGASFLIFAAACTLMMAFMMNGMHGGNKH